MNYASDTYGAYERSYIFVVTYANIHDLYNNIEIIYCR